MTPSGHFVGIDNGDLFNRTNAAGSLVELQKMKAAGVQFTPEEIVGLQVYRDTLAQLISQFDSNKINIYMDEAIALSGLPKVPVVNPDFSPNFSPSLVAGFKNFEMKNIEESKKLRAVLDNLLSEYR